MPLLVTASIEEARAEAAGGRDVVLMVRPGAPGAPGARVGDRGHGPGRIHLFVGDPSDPAATRAAAEMAAELGAVKRAE
jgi:hypothetical protein